MMNSCLLLHFSFGLVCPLFVDFYYDIPRVTYSHIFGIPVTGKSVVYLVGLQVHSYFILLLANV